ncbi:hypothetical protein [Candidatus Liberibacter sp.]|uniref:hypothetical protein n=1 Tax=Candidatus Liberibacter sp. TaxID=34022 RepID=UPI0015F4A2AB|nr:hypothetical protein [Candidatus Liberibacter sp.]MBA5724284.1 hypothetical protein [Candidatus Liberibacter sp.]
MKDAGNIDDLKKFRIETLEDFKKVMDAFPPEDLSGWESLYLYLAIKEMADSNETLAYSLMLSIKLIDFILKEEGITTHSDELIFDEYYERILSRQMNRNRVMQNFVKTILLTRIGHMKGLE